EFEQKIKASSTDKFQLLEIWSDYIFWYEQNVLNGKGIKELIERGLGDLDQVNELFDSDKYVKIWLKYVQNIYNFLIGYLDEKEETFQYLISNAPKKTEETAEARNPFTDIMLKSGETAIDRVTNLKTGIKSLVYSAKPISTDPSSFDNKISTLKIYQEKNKTNSESDVSVWKNPLIKTKVDKDNIIGATSWQGQKLIAQKLPPTAKDGISIQGIFQDDDCFHLSKNRCHLVQPSSMPISIEGEKIPWIVSTEIENKHCSSEFSIEELMSLRYYHLNFNHINHPLKYQLVERFESIPT
ncbi:hypothetical protein HZS_3083, partial [Henneguya salminicola]